MNVVIRHALMTVVCLVTAHAASAQPNRLSATCSAPPRINCPEANCPVDQVRADGNAVEPKTGRRFFFDYPCDLKPGEEVVFVLSLHGAGSIGNWQRHYFPIVDLKDKYRLVIATPTAATSEPTRRWVAEADDEFLRNVVDVVFDAIGPNNIRSFWLAGHSQGGITSRRIICSDYFRTRVDGWLSLSGGRLGQTRVTFARAPVAAPATPASAAEQLPDCDFSFIYTAGELEIAGLPTTSPWAEKYGCGARERRPDIIDTRAGYVTATDQSRGPSWGRFARPGKAEAFVYPACHDGKVVADFIRLDKGHTEGLEPNVLEEIVKLMVSARGGKARPTESKGGDDRNGAYDAVPNWWKPAPEHDATWTWGEVSGLAADTSDRIIVAIWGDRNRQNQPRPNATNYLVVVNRNGDIVERWQQWDSILNRPHQVYISPYDPQRHVWIVERGGGRDVPMSILKFTNDGKQLVMRLGDGGDPRNRNEARANPKPGPFDFGDPACLAFFPDGSFLLADGYWNSRIVKYNAKGEYQMEWGALGKGPGQFDLVHGVAIDRDRRVYVADRTNNRIQLFTEQGTFIEEWPDITDPVGVYIDERNAVWVVSAALNRILKYNRDGALQYHWGTYGGTRGGFAGGLARPHQIDVDQEGNAYIASWDGGWVTKYVPKPGADPEKLVGRKLLIPR